MHNVVNILERRLAQRFRVALAVELDGGTGVTCDVSSSGVFFATERSFSCGEHIRFTLVLERGDPQRQMYLQCQGKVVRVERRAGRERVAVAISAYRLATQACVEAAG
jgi:PilZ domain